MIMGGAATSAAEVSSGAKVPAAAEVSAAEAGSEGEAGVAGEGSASAGDSEGDEEGATAVFGLAAGVVGLGVVGLGVGVAAGLSLADRVLDGAAEGATTPTLAVSCACAGASDSGKRVSAASKVRVEERGRKACGESCFVGWVQNVKGVAGCIVG
jgi:hypothetical protein